MIKCSQGPSSAPRTRSGLHCLNFHPVNNNQLFMIVILLNKIHLREGFKKSKWKFKMAFAIRRPTPPPLNGKISRHFFSFAIESYIYETDFIFGPMK